MPSGRSNQGPLYAMITDVLRRAIMRGSLQKGAVILEGPIAELLNSTRTPVRQALQYLAQMGVLSRFEGRGYVVGKTGTEPKRITLTATMLGITGQPMRKALGWESIYDEIERHVVHLSVFEGYRLNEMELARHVGVGRMVAHDVLLRLERLGLIQKDERLRWEVIPLDAKRIANLYALRGLLEPVALKAAVSAGSTIDLQMLTTSLQQAIETYPSVTPAAMNKLEHDLHVELLSHCPNTDLLHCLERTRSVLTLSKHVLGASAPMPRRDPFMSEHLAILSALSQGDCEMAQNLLRAHLEHSCAKVIRRVEHVRKTYTKPLLPYASLRSIQS